MCFLILSRVSLGTSSTSLGAECLLCIQHLHPQPLLVSGSLPLRFLIQYRHVQVFTSHHHVSQLRWSALDLESIPFSLHTLLLLSLSDMFILFFSNRKVFFQDSVSRVLWLSSDLHLAAWRLCFYPVNAGSCTGSRKSVSLSHDL